VVRYLARHGQDRASKAVLMSALPPLMVRTSDNPDGTPMEVFDGLQRELAEHRARFYLDFAAGPSYGYNRPGAQPQEGVIRNWWRQGMMGSITLPVLVLHGDDDQVVPYADSAPLTAQLLPHATLKTHAGFPHGMPTTHAEVINADILAFIQGDPD